MARGLDNRLVDMVVAVGMNQNTGLVPATTQPTHGISSDPDFYDTLFDPATLAAISSNAALFPSSSSGFDCSYPPSQANTRDSSIGKYPSFTFPGGKTAFRTLQTRKKPQVKIREQAKSPGDEDDIDNKSDEKFGNVENYVTIKRSLTRKPSFRPVDFANKKRSSVISVKPDDMPLSSESVAALSHLCFPDGARVYREKPTDKIHHLVRTDINGNRSYATCLTYFTKGYAHRTAEQNGWQLNVCEAIDKETTPEDAQFVCYVPICLILLSKFPYYTLMKDALSRLVGRLRSDHCEDWDMTLKDFTLRLTMVCVPPPGPACVHFSLFDVTMPIHPSNHVDRQVVDLPLNLAFQCFNINSILKITNLLLLQQRVVFVSSSYSMLTIISESFLHFIAPFKWRFPYVPVLASIMLDYVEAPGTFIMGCHSDHLSQVEKVEGLAVVNIDNGDVRMCKSIRIPSLPQDPARLFKRVCQQFKTHLETQRFEGLTSFTYEEAKAAELEHREKRNSAISTAFLELMVNVFRDVLIHIKPEKNFFHREQFLQGIPETDRRFYEEMLETDMFSDFLKDRLAEKKDDWAELVDKTRPANRNSLSYKDSEGFSPSHMRRTQSLSSLSCISLQLIYGSQSDVRWTPIALPDFVYGLSPVYFHNCLRKLSTEIQDCQTPDMRASYLYLMGMLHGACGQHLDALSNFHDLASCNARLFPSQYVSDLMSNLNSKEDEVARKMILRKSNILMNVTLDRQPVREKPIIMQLNKIPEEDIDFDGFCELVEMLDISADRDSICRLFAALTLSQEAVDGQHSIAMVDPDTFEEFYKCWKENEVDLVKANIPESHLEQNECVLKLSNLTKTSIGTGRIVLTPKRLLFLPEGSRKCKEVIKLRNIKTIEQHQQRSLFSTNPALKIHSKGDRTKPFMAVLKAETSVWGMLIGEMWSGKIISEEFKDPAVIQLAMQNVLLIDAYIKSSEAEFTTHHSQGLELASVLCYYKGKSDRGVDKLPVLTKDVLQHRIDPNGNETDRVAVESLLYIVGTRSGGSPTDHGPELWCGLGNGRIRVYDASTWLIDRNFNFQAKNKVACLLRVGESQIWAASLDSVIYVIDRAKRSINQTLVEHSDFVTDLTVSADNSVVFSGSADGTIVRWNAQTMQHVAKFKVGAQPGRPSVTLIAIQYSGGILWCCTRTSLIEVNSEGTVLRTFTGQNDLIGHASLHSSLDYLSVGNLNLGCFLLTAQNEVWMGLRDRGEIIVCYADTLEIKKTIKVGDSGFTRMIQTYDKIWAGTKSGKIHIYNCQKYVLEKSLPEAHSDAIRAICTAANRYVLTGASSKDGTVSIWRSSIV